MKKIKKTIVVMVVALVMVSAGVAYAATAKSPGEIVSGLTGKTIESVYAERSNGKTMGTIAKEAGKLEEFKAQMLEQKKAVLDQRVSENAITQEKADEIYNNILNNQANCNGEGGNRIGQREGLGFGQGAGKGMGQGKGQGQGMGFGGRLGNGLGTGQQ
jgi:hypothetical protein